VIAEHDAGRRDQSVWRLRQSNARLAGELQHLAALLGERDVGLWAARVWVHARRDRPATDDHVLHVARLVALARGHAPPITVLRGLATSGGRSQDDAAAASPFSRSLPLVALNAQTRASIRQGQFRLDLSGARNGRNPPTEQLNALMQQSLLLATDRLMRDDSQFQGWRVLGVEPASLVPLDGGNLPLRSYRIELTDDAGARRTLSATPQWTDGSRSSLSVRLTNLQR
jgi:hypothetical protein